MRFLLTALTLALTTISSIAQHRDEGPGGMLSDPRKLTVLPALVPGAHIDHVARHFDISSTAGSPRAAHDISQISTFPFQTPYATSLSYSESCPFLLGNGNILVVYAGPFLDSLYAVRSTDGGASWSSPSFVCTTLRALYLSGVRTAQGHIVLVWTGDYYTLSGPSGLVTCTSENDGTTWTTSSTLTTNVSDVYPTVSQTLDGTVWLCYSRFNGGTSYDLYRRTSTDNGVTWGAEQSLFASANAEPYGVIISRDSSTIAAIDLESATGSYGIYQRTSTDAGATWSSASVVATTGEFDFRPRALRHPDGTLWVVYQAYNPGTGGSGESEIEYTRSTNGGTSWSAAAKLTNYAGFDGGFNACLEGNTPFVTFASDRWCPRMGQTHLWYGLIGTSTDYSPPPSLISYANTTLSPGDAESIRAYVDDETGIANVQLWYVINGVQFGPVQMFDDGVHGDYASGDRIYGATIGSLHLGETVEYSIGITDVSANAVTVYATAFTLPAIHSAGNIVLQFSPNSEIGNLGAPGVSAYWPKSGGYDYLFDGGLWAGCNIGGQNTVVKQWYANYMGWTRTAATPFTLGPGISDQDGDVTYDDLTAYPRIGLQVHQQSYQWSKSSRSNFIIVEYTLTNTGLNGTLNNLYAALWTDPDVAIQTNAMSNGAGYDSLRHLVYAYNTSNLPGGYFGIKLLGRTAAPSTVYAWRAGSLDAVAVSTPYQLLTQGGTTLPDSVGDVRMMITAAPFSLGANSSRTVPYGIVMGNGLAELRANADTMEAVFESMLATSVGPAPGPDGIPQEFSLSQNYPNPFNPSTTIRFGLPERSQVTLAIYNMLGQQVATLLQSACDPGFHEIRFDGSDLSSGTYFYRLRAGKFTQTRRFLLLK